MGNGAVVSMQGNAEVQIGGGVKATTFKFRKIRLYAFTYKYICEKRL